MDQLGFSDNPSVAQTLAEIARNPDRSTLERQLAMRSGSQVSIASQLMPAGVFILGATSGRTAALAENVFTSALSEGLLGRADRDGDGTITANDLTKYVAESTRLIGPDNPRPYSHVAGPRDITLVGRDTSYSEVLALVVGANPRDAGDIPSIATDAELFAITLGQV